MNKPHIWIASPASARNNNGNWQSARRWAQFLRTRYRVTIAQSWPEPAAAPSTAGPSAAATRATASGVAATRRAAPAALAAPRPSRDGERPDLLIALHARRSAPALLAFAQSFPGHPTILLLTGTDLYRDIQHDPQAQAALECATALVLLQPAGLSELPPHLHAKTSVIYQSAATLRPARSAPATDAPTVQANAHAAAPLSKRRHADISMIGHLRDEKDPLTFMQAAAVVTAPSARLLHIGGALEPELGAAAEAAMQATPRYHWLGALPRAVTRQRLKRSHAMAIASRMEGGANVIIEAVTSGVPVLASDISGNRGMLGEDYAGYFPLGDAAALARLIDRSINDPAWLATLRQQCAARAPLFAPEAERAALLTLVDNLLHSTHNPARNPT